MDFSVFQRDRNTSYFFFGFPNFQNSTKKKKKKALNKNDHDITMEEIRIVQDIYNLNFLNVLFIGGEEVLQQTLRFFLMNFSSPGYLHCVRHII